MKRVGLVLCMGLLVAGCYLPQPTVDRPLQNQVLIAVYRCTPEFVAGDARNDADVDVTVVLKPLWLDGNSQPFHEVIMDPLVIPAGETLEWEGLAGAEVERPVFCGAEVVEVSAT